MAEIKTKQNDGDVNKFLDQVADENTRLDLQKIAAMMEKSTSKKPKMWGDSIVGFGERHVKSASGREVDWFEVGFSPRKANLSLYLNIGEGWDEELLAQLGKHKIGKGCLYFKRLSDIDEKVLENLVKKSVENIRRK